MTGMQTMTAFVLAAGARASADGAAPAGQIDGLGLLGFLSALGALVCYAHRGDGRVLRVLLAAFVLALAAYAFAAGAWPVGLAEVGWGVVAVRRCFRHPGRWARAHAAWAARSVPAATPAPPPRRNVADVGGRLHRLFGPS